MKHTTLPHKAGNVADFRAQLEQATAQAQTLSGVPILPCEEQAGDTALIEALADVIMRTYVVELPYPAERKVA
jgi:hypothetical protein